MSATVLKMGMDKIDKQMKRKYPDGDAAIILTIHDELVFETRAISWRSMRDIASMCISMMTDIPEVSSKVRLEATMSVVPEGKSWFDKKEVTPKQLKMDRPPKFLRKLIK